MNKGNLVVKKFLSSSNGKDVNAYMLIDGGEAAIIDVADTYDDVKDALREHKANLKYILITHGHSSHLRSASRVKRDLGGQICFHEHDNDLIEKVDETLKPDIPLKDKTKLRLNGTEIKVFHTPGHTRGSVCYYIEREKMLFSGDTLFKGEYGKIWGPTSMGLMLRTLKRLNNVILSSSTVYPGHGDSTTMYAEAWLDCLDNLS
ncbi:MAG TPA: MBL fold metallo-hydrolase [Syntrophales bacterium]|nr:MBL fold metallo-hydrolase [Syntrophales bacterium]